MEDVGLIVDIVLALGAATIGGLIAQRLGLGEMESPHARVALGLGIVQDFSLAPMLAPVPVIAGQRGGGFGIAESLLISAVVLIVAFLLGTRLVPPLLRIVARSGSRELFMLTA